jgi:hypothetical protein
MTRRGYVTAFRASVRREDTLLVLVGLAGLVAAAFPACGGSSFGAASDGGATTDAASAADGGVTSDASSSGDVAAVTTAACATSASTAANTADVVTAANALAATLTSAQQSTIQLGYELANVQQWSNLPTSFIPRNGVMIGDMSSDAQTAAVALVATAAGTTGSTLFSELRAADEFLVTDGHADSNSYGQGRYYIAFVGTPSTTSPWMLQVAGHHIAYNFTYNGQCTSATPLFDGVEPTTWTDSSNTSHAPLEAQRAASAAVIAAVATDPASLLSGTFTDVVNGPTNQNGKGDTRYPSGLTYPTGTTGRGVLVGSLSAANQALVKTAIEAWVKNVADPIATALLAQYESDEALAQTYVAYSGATDLSTKDSYFRIDGPRVWIEYTIQGGIVYPSRVHYHTIWRDKASDYGADFVDADAGAASSTDSGGGTGGPPSGDGGAGGPPFGDAGPPSGEGGPGGQTSADAGGD